MLANLEKKISDLTETIKYARQLGDLQTVDAMKRFLINERDMTSISPDICWQVEMKLRDEGEWCDKAD